MFGWAITFLIVAIVAGVFGFAGVAGTAAWIAKVLFAVGLVMFLALLAAGRRPPTPGNLPQRMTWEPGSLFYASFHHAQPDVAEPIQNKQIKTMA